MIYETIGERLLADAQQLETLLMHSGRNGLISLIEACIEGGWDTEEAILAKVHQVGGPYYAYEVPKLLAIHAAPLARPKLWFADEYGRYRLVQQGWRPTDMSFWRPAYQPYTDRDLAA